MRRVTIDLADPKKFCPVRQWDSRYPVELIRNLMETTGPAWLCDELRRDEDPTYVERDLRQSILPFVSEKDLSRGRLLDFGSGRGASLAILGRMAPEGEFVGVELSEPSVRVSRERTAFYGLKRVEFYTSPSGDSLPPNLGTFDYVLLSAVFEHLLPAERPLLLRMLWSILKPGGILFLNQTPYRYWPFEGHTTQLPLINYLPDRAAHWTALHLSRRIRPGTSWTDLLRGGIRGGSTGEIIALLPRDDGAAPVLLAPSRLGCRDLIDVWNGTSSYEECPPVKRLAFLTAKVLKGATGHVFLPTLFIAIRKAAKQA